MGGRNGLPMIRCMFARLGSGGGVGQEFMGEAREVGVPDVPGVNRGGNSGIRWAVKTREGAKVRRFQGVQECLFRFMAFDAVGMNNQVIDGGIKEVGCWR